MTNKEIIIKEFSQLKGLVIVDFKVSRLIGVVEDEEEMYWCLYDGQQIHLASCLQNMIALKGKIDIQEYNEMIRVCKLNHNDQPISFSWANEDEVKDMVEVHKQQLLAWCYGHNHFIAGPDWSLSYLKYTQ
jgi:hypothetical protein